MVDTTKWRVSSNFIYGVGYQYKVFRNKYENEPDHTGNREYADGTYETEQEAQIRADMLNHIDKEEK